MRFAAGPATLCALAAVAGAAAIQLSSGMYQDRALPFALAAAVLAVAGAVWMRSAPRAGDLTTAQTLLGGGCAAGLALHVSENPTFYGDARMLQGGFRWFAVLGLILLSAYLCIHLRASLVKARFLLLLLCFAIMGIVVLRASPRPWMDVWTIQQGAADAFLHGLNPFSVGYPDIYGRLTSQMYAPGMVRNGLVFSFPYPPLALLTDLPGFVIFGDVRFSMLALMVFAAWAFARAAEGAGGELAALFILFQPRTFFVLEQAWIEPVVLAAFALTALLSARWKAGKAGPVAAGIALGLLLASKQYSPYLALPLFLTFPERGRWRALLVAAGVCAAVLLPFAAWDFQGFWRGLVEWQLNAPRRDDALSLVAFLDRHGGAPALLITLAPLAGVLVLLATLRRRVTLAQAAAAGAAAFLAIVVVYKQAFCNYYWVSVALLAAAVAARSRAGETA